MYTRSCGLPDDHVLDAQVLLVGLNGLLVVLARVQIRLVVRLRDGSVGIAGLIRRFVVRGIAWLDGVAS